MNQGVYDKRMAAQKALGALYHNVDIITDALIGPLTTVAGLIALFDASGTTEQNVHRRRSKITFERAAHSDNGIFTDANVAAANTRSGLFTLCSAVNADLASVISGNGPWPDPYWDE